MALQVRLMSTDVTRQLQCAGLNRRGVEDESSLRERRSEPLGLESFAATARCPVKHKQGIDGLGIQLRKIVNLDADAVVMAEGNTVRRDSASFYSVPRIRRPHARLETPAREPGDLGDACRAIFRRTAGEGLAARPACTSPRSHTAA